MKVLKIKYLTIIILMINSLNTIAQIFDNSQPHFKVRWNQIDTKNFRLIYPKEFDSSASHLASQIEKYITYSASRLQTRPRKIDIILQQNHLLQNGFAQLAPRKSEFYSTPSGIADNQEWLPNLALHEIHHIAQFDKLTGNIKKPFGELLALAFFGINLPSWYYEGDAVLHETLFSKGGRGRLTSWNMEIRANLQSQKRYNFNKYVHGSFKDLVPSYYTIGYFMNSQLQAKDPNTTAKIYEEMNGKLLRPFNFQRALRNNYGKKATGIFEETVKNLEQIWSTSLQTNLSEPLFFKDKYPTDYYLPQLQNNEIYALKTGKQHISHIVKFNADSPTKTREIIKTGAQIMPYFHLKNHLITWDELRKDARFSKQTYNVINIFDINSHTKKTITKNSRYYSPIISSDLHEVACIEVNLNNESSIAILDINSGNKIDSIGLPHGLHIQQPSFNKQSTKILAIAVNEWGTNILEINRENKEIKTLFKWSNLQYERPVYAENGIIFKVNQNGKDDIFLYNGHEIAQITNSKFGAFNPSVYNDTILFNDYTIKGYKVNKVNLNTVYANQIKFEESNTLYPTQNDYHAENIDSISTNKYTIKPYNTLKNSINFHSLTLSANDFESFDNYKPGIYWLSNDVLNTTRVKLGYEREVELGKNTYLGEITYQRYYPKFTIGYRNTGNFGWARTADYKDSIRFDFRNHQITADIQLPFSIYRGNNIYSYGLNAGTYYIKRYDLTLTNLQNFVDEIKFPLNYQAYLNRNAMMSPMDLAPRWGQNISIIARHTPFSNQNDYSWAIRTNFYFPGLFQSHSFQARWSLQKTKGVFNGYYDIPLIHGFTFLPRNDINNTLLFDYRLPLAYPDLSIGQLAYIKRFHGKISADYINLNEASISPQALTIELNTDFNIFKYNEPLITFGISGTYLNSSQVKNNFIPSFSLSYNY